MVAPLHLNLHSVLFAPSAEKADSLLGEIYERGTAGIVEEGDRIRAFFEDETDHSDLLSAYPVLEMRREDAHSDPIPASADCDPIFAGEKFFIVPALSTQATPEGRYRLTINDTAAFGTGRHETTQLMLAALEQTLTPGQTVFDVGSGSGILSIAAQLLGAKQAWSCDIYEDGVRSSHRHSGLSAFVGSADAVRDHLAGIALANITPRILDAIAYDLKRASEPDGQILISGFLRGGEPKRFKPEKVWELNEWLCWRCRPQDIDAEEERPQTVIHHQEWW